MVYVFTCPFCKIEEDITLAVDERDNELLCASCGEVMKREITCAPFHLKGHGWARDGYSTTIGNILKTNGTFKTDEEGGRKD